VDNVSLTYFVDFVMKSGPPKATVVQRFKQRQAYDPRVDFYRRMRNAIVEMHEKGLHPRELDQIVARLSDEKKRIAYPQVVRGYKKFIGKKQYTWFKPPRGEWTPGPLVVNLNPEVGLEVGGKRIVGKLYFKTEALTKQRADVIAHLMDQVLRSKLTQPARFVVIDVRQGRAFEPTVPVPTYNALLAGEAASFAEIYKAL
jgi:hypothetical protein